MVSLITRHATVGLRSGVRVLLPLICLVAACGGGGSPTAATPAIAREMSSMARSYLTQLLDIMQANSINRKTIDWPAFRQMVVGEVPSAQTIQDLYPRIRAALSLLNDHHSFYVGPDSTLIRSHNGSPLVSVSTPYRLLRGNPRVAVLTNCGVASSGEAVVIGFRATRSARSFGTPTYGLSTSNDEFAITGGGTLILTVSVMADRTGRTYGSAVAPDEVIADPGETVRRAAEWLRQ